MAELSPPHPAAVAEAIARLRWRLFLNSLRTKRGQMEMVARIVSTMTLSALGVGGALVCAVAAWWMASRGHDAAMAMLLWAILAFWQLMPLMASAFSQVADSSSLLRFPLDYRVYALIRLAFSAFDPYAAAAGLFLLGTLAGVVAARPEMLPAALLAVMLFAVFNLLLALAIFTWTERWLARRRSREIMAAAFFLLVFGAQLIGPLLRRLHAGHASGGGQVRAWLMAALPLLAWTPPGLVTQLLGAPTLGWVAALAVLVGWCGGVAALLHLRLRREFRGENFSQAAAARAVVPAARPAAPPPEVAVAAVAAVRLEGDAALPSVAGAVAVKEIRTLVRNPPLLFNLAAPLFILALLGLGRGGGHGHHPFPPSLALPLATFYCLIVLTALIYNCFGTDGAGISVYFTAPVEMRAVFMGKNLAYGGVLAVETVLVWGLAAMLFGRPSAVLALATAVGLVFAALLNFTAGNLFSIAFPRPLQLGRLGRQGGAQVSNLGAIAMQAGIGALAALALLPGYLAGNFWIAVGLLAVLAAVAAFVYRASLGHASRRALARREALLTDLVRAA